MDSSTSCSTQGSPLADHHLEIVKICPKLQATEKILARCKHAPSVIISSFLEMTLIVEHISQYSILALIHIKIKASDIL